MISVEIIPQEIVSVVTVSTAPASVAIIDAEAVTAEVQPYSVVSNPSYDGAYTVASATRAQTLATSGKKCNLDITIEAIPTSETPNASGTTFSIGS